MKIVNKFHIFTLIIIVLASFALKAVNINYNSPFNDEAIYIVVGKLGVFNNDWESLTPFNWMGGVPFFYPTITSIAYELGGISFSRLLNIVIFIASLVVVYKLTVLVYPGKVWQKNNSALVSTAILAGAANGYYVSRLATYDMPSFFFLLLSVYYLFAAQQSKKYPAGKYFLSAIAMVLSLLFKYVTGLFVPVLVVYSYMVVRRKTRYRKRVWVNYYLIPIIMALVLFGLFRFENLNSFLHGQVIPSMRASYRDLFVVFLREINFLMVFTLFGVLGFIVKRKWKHLLVITTISLVVFAAHLADMRYFTLDKHLFLTVAGFSVIAGIGVGLLGESFNKRIVRETYWLTLSTCIIAFWIVSNGISKDYNYRWVNTNQALSYVVENSHSGDIILSETGADMQLAMIGLTHPTKVYTFDWINYERYSGDEAVYYGLRDGYFDVVALLNQNVVKWESIERIHNLAVSNLDEIYSVKFENENITVYFRNY